MTARTAVVTGAAGFLGRFVVNALAEKHWYVRAGVHHERDLHLFASRCNVEPVVIDLSDRISLAHAVEGCDHLYHCAALVDSHAGRDRLLEVNAHGTRRLWEAASGSRVKKALYISTTAVYGLLRRNGSRIAESSMPRAIEPYGNSKLHGELAALEVGSRTGLHTTILRPVAIFGPGEHTPFGRSLRDAAVSNISVAGGFQGRSFSYVHVEDVAAAALHVMAQEIPGGEAFNVAAQEPITFEEAFRQYVAVLKDAGRAYARVRMLAGVSTLLHRSPSALRWASALLGDRYLFGLWHPGFDLTYSSDKLLSTSFEFHWKEFGPTFASCVEGTPA